MSQRERNRKSARIEPVRQPGGLIYVVHEGELTEPQYFKGLERACRKNRVELKLARVSGNPSYYVDKAIELKNKNDDDLDQFWCVFDQDDHTVKQLDEAKRLADLHGIHLVVSIPSLELWLYLHHKENPGMATQAEMQKKLKRILPDYNKSVEFQDYQSGYHDAVKRSAKMIESAESENDFWRNPTTRIHLLCESIRGDCNW
jgi:hypothetical protein